jgi:hypothetical protein
MRSAKARYAIPSHQASFLLCAAIFWSSFTLQYRERDLPFNVKIESKLEESRESQSRKRRG